MQLAPGCDQSMDPRSEDPQVLSIDQIRSIRASNNYVERPACGQQSRSSPTLRHKHECSQASSPCRDPQLSRSSTASSVSQGTAASEQRLLSLSPSRSGQSLARTPPGSGRSPARTPPGSGPSPARTPPKAELSPPQGHALRCEACGRCRCPRCTAARSLPSCWLCRQRCLCSAESLLDYGTCLCCVKGLFYHCSTDDEDTCADEPCSCGPGACCARWAAMGALSLLLPCLCCYFPTLGCLKLCQRGYDGLRRPGCRCRSHTNTVCRKISSAGGTPFPKALDKPV